MNHHHCRGPGLEIDEKAPVLLVHEIDIEAPVEVVWQLHVEVCSWPVWQPDIAVAHQSCALGPGASFDWTTSGNTFTSTVYDLAEGSHIRWGGEVHGIIGVQEWHFDARPGGVHVTTRESFAGPAAEENQSLMQAELDTAMTAWLHHLRRAAEERWAAAQRSELPDESPPAASTQPGEATADSRTEDRVVLAHDQEAD